MQNVFHFVVINLKLIFGYFFHLSPESDAFLCDITLPSSNVCPWQVLGSATYTETDDGAKSVVKVKASDMTIFCKSQNGYGTHSVEYNIKAVISELTAQLRLSNLCVHVCEDALFPLPLQLSFPPLVCVCVCLF